MSIRRRTTTRVTVEHERGVFMISVAAELADMHPQTLRMYEARGLIEPKRSPKGTRLYSHSDVERLRRIQEMTAELGMNLAGVERVFELEEQLESMSRKVQALEKRAAELKAEVQRLASRAARRGCPVRQGWRDRAPGRLEGVQDPRAAPRVLGVGAAVGGHGSGPPNGSLVQRSR
jgi:MerR family transcriptional regulator/heat shock protein HspR